MWRPTDPVAQANRYLYANASPLNGTDPDGHRLTCESDDGSGSHFCVKGEWGADSPAQQSNTTSAAMARTVATQRKREIAAANSLNHDHSLRNDRGPRLVFARVYAHGTQELEFDDGTVVIDGFVIPDARAGMNPDELAARMDYWRGQQVLIAGADAETQTAHLILVSHTQVISRPGATDIPPIQLPLDLVSAALYDAAAANGNGAGGAGGAATGALAGVMGACQADPRMCSGGGRVDGRQVGSGGG